MWPWQRVEWYDTVIFFCLVWHVYLNGILQDYLYHNMDISTMCQYALVSCTPSQFLGLFLGVHCLCVECNYAPLTNFYHDILTTYLDFLLVMQMRAILDVSAPGPSLWILDWICHLRTPYMSCLDSLSGYSTGQFQAFQLIVFAACGTIDQPHAPCMLVYFLEIKYEMMSIRCNCDCESVSICIFAWFNSPLISIKCALIIYE